MSVSSSDSDFELIHPRSEHFLEIQNLCRRVYPFAKPWSIDQLESHQSYFPDGQLIVIDAKSRKVLGLAFSLIISWDDYSPQDNWQDFTSGGFFHNHNPKKGKTLYGAEIMVDPEVRGRGIGKLLYQGRRKIVERYGLKRIRAGARLRGYSKFHDRLTPEQYVKEVVERRIYDPTLSFQLNQGFVAIDVAKNYLFNDPESLGYAAVIEWLNPEVATARDIKMQKESVHSFLSGTKYIPQFLPKELRRIVRKASVTLGKIIREVEGETFYRRIDHYRDALKKARVVKDKNQLVVLLNQLRSETRVDRFKVAHAFALHLEVVNICETAYRTWRQQQKPVVQGLKSKVDLTFVLTAHPTEARSQPVVNLIGSLGRLLIEGMQNNFVFDDQELSSQLRLLWLYPFSNQKTPSVLDEARYIYSIIFSKEIFDFILSEKPSYDLKLRTWVGGDKDGHPFIDQVVMRECLIQSRSRILQVLHEKLDVVLRDLHHLESVNRGFKSKIDLLSQLVASLKSLKEVTRGDGDRIRKWSIQYRSLLRSSATVIQKHSQILAISRIFDLFPGLVLPLELREDSTEIEKANTDLGAPIRKMLMELRSIAGGSDITHYARGLVISRCERVEDLGFANQLVLLATKSKNLPIIPLFESKEALQKSQQILRDWLRVKENLERTKRYWGGRFEVMLGYSDSSKQMGVLPSRYLILKTIFDLEKTLKSRGLKPIFFHGSGGSIARGGGSLKEQISWWSLSAIQTPKMTIQGEMIQRLFATKEILNSQCVHMSNELLRRRIRKVKFEVFPELESFVRRVELKYRELITNTNLLSTLLESTPYRYLDLLQLGSRPSKRPTGEISVASLRAIPWVLCWTQTRILWTNWWGLGSVWEESTSLEKETIKKLFISNPFFSSFVKMIGFTLSKVELEIWELYFLEMDRSEIFSRFRSEYDGAVKFVREVSQEKSLIWYRPWLEESIRLRAPYIHILNLLQILSMKERDESLLKETLVGIACGMLTTG